MLIIIHQLLAAMCPCRSAELDRPQALLSFRALRRSQRWRSGDRSSTPVSTSRPHQWVIKSPAQAQVLDRPTAGGHARREVSETSRSSQRARRRGRLAAARRCWHAARATASAMHCSAGGVRSLDRVVRLMGDGYGAGAAECVLVAARRGDPARCRC